MMINTRGHSVLAEVIGSGSVVWLKIVYAEGLFTLLILHTESVFNPLIATGNFTAPRRII